jgi:hypothetical protein
MRGVHAMTPLLRGDLSDVSFPADLPRLREEAHLALQEGMPLSPLFQALARDHPMALGDLVVGPGALTGAVAVREALGTLDTLEEMVPAGGLYHRLVTLGEASRDEVLQAAVRRHPRASWIIRLSREVEPHPGTAHLAATEQEPWFGAICQSHAEAGHVQALFALAGRGRLEPVTALLAVGRDDDALEAAATALNHVPECPLVAHVAAFLGPRTDAWLCRLVSRLRSAEAARSLGQQATPFARTSAMVAAILPALR